VLLSPIKVPFKLTLFGLRNGYRGTKLSIKYGYKGTKVASKYGFKKAKVFVNQYKEGEGIFSYRNEDTRQRDIDGDVLEVGQIRGRR
ncbi:MAG: hypothetical protein F6K11_28240, partial [Leptolyngbya sp. SIO3F4]|nr:hypothetical protein [Leptolyngbya sp. SIO3F4]